jgi:uncharacterized protein (DUF1697 family)
MSGKTVYILLFRGVGGATQLPVKPLKEALTAAGFENVGTYINSGNAFLRTDMPKAKMLETVARICRDAFGFTKEIHAPTLEEWRKVIENNPFPDAKEGTHLHAAWLDGEPKPNAVEALRAVCAEGEGIEVVGRVAYLHTPHGFGRSKLAERFDKLIGVANTARNWNTVVKLREMAEAAV